MLHDTRLHARIGCPACEQDAFARNTWFDGKYVTAADLVAEQDYFLSKHRRHDRLLHGWGVTEVPSAGALRSYNHTCANMLLYWNLLQRSVERGQAVFDFGRSSQDSPTFRFKKQWGAEPVAAQWQCYARSGSSGEMRPDNPSYGRLVRLWRRLPLWLTRRIGPSVVRGIP